LMEVFAVFGLLLLITANILTGSKNPADIITIGAFIAAAYKIIPGLVRIVNVSGQINAYSFTVDGLMQENENLQPEHRAKDCPVITSYSFNNVHFSYKGTPVIAGCSFEICRGRFVGIAGPSGKGKTTIVYLLLGFLAETAGAININGKLCSAEDRKKYQSRIAYVKQQNFLINDTIEKNITLDEIGCDKERMQAVIKASGLTSLVNQYDEGVKKIINENGKNISGGQRQRIAIARALYKDADMIILDEPFNELDTASEIKLLQQFKQLAKQGKIVILITHQKESLSFCDKVISLDEG
jgi:ABC-type bacteriocin/lantibiotic exporter with double-glycine peptidase domain